MTPSVASPQSLGTTVTWTVKATDTAANDLTFQFNVAPPRGTSALVEDFNVGTLAGGVWTAQPFVWTTIVNGEGIYTVEVVAKDFVTGESATQTAEYQLNTRVSGGAAVVHESGNALVALFSAPACPSGSTMRVAFYTGTASPNYTTWAHCLTKVSMNVYVAGMLPSTTYAMYSQTSTNGKITNGTTVTFTTKALPSQLPACYLPTFKVNTAASPSDPNPLLLWSFTKLIVPVATNLSGQIMWYYGTCAGTLLTRPVAGGTMLAIENGTSWDSSNTTQQILREFDFAGNIIHQTNTGVIANQLVAMGATDATPCGAIKTPVAGDACLNDFHHDAIRFIVNGQDYTAFMAHIEKLFPAGTQGHAGPDPVDVLSEMVIVLNSNWQVVWYYDAFNQLNINRAAPLGETCSPGTSDCPTNLFLSTSANDWTHANTCAYVAAPSSDNPDAGDFIVSMRDQDELIRVNYNNGAGNCALGQNCIGWYMGPPDNDNQSNFTFNNISNDPWPWFSHQHDATYASSGLQLTINGQTDPLLTIFDNGNTRYSNAPLGLGSNCDVDGVDDCNSRGMALSVDEATWEVTPVLSQDLGVQTTALGGANLLSNMNYFFSTGINTATPAEAIEIQPTAGQITGTVVLNVEGSSYAYRGWQMPNLYNPPNL